MTTLCPLSLVGLFARFLFSGRIFLLVSRITGGSDRLAARAASRRGRPKFEMNEDAVELAFEANTCGKL